MRPDSIHEQDSASASHKLEAEVRELRETAFRYEDIIANMELGILEVDREECIVRAHPRFCEIVGYPESELIGKKASEVFLGASDDKGLMQERTRMRNEGKSGTYEVEIVTGTGEHKWLLISGVPRRNADGVVIGSMGIHQDITARKRAEVELVKSKEAAEAAQRAEREFLTRMSHEIRTPMNAILGMADLLAHTPLNAEQLNLLSSIEGGGVVLKQLLDDVLDLAKLEFGKRSVERTRTRLDEILLRVTDVFRPSLLNKGVALDVDLDVSLKSPWMADAAAVTQVAMNAMGNAAKFTEAGRIALSARIETLKPDRHQLVVDVRDTGIGIAEADVGAVFDRFRQASNREVGHGGSGLGLAIARELCLIHGGDATVQSQLGTGSAFRFTFTVLSIENVGSGPVDVQESGFPGMRVLVAEDNEVNRFFIETLLTSWDVEVAMVETGQQALNAMADGDFDLVLMDIQMPEMDGLEATRQHRAREVESGAALHLPIIALSAFAFDHDRKAALEAGMDGHVSKPFSRADIVEVLARHFTVDL